MPCIAMIVSVILTIVKSLRSMCTNGEQTVRPMESRYGRPATKCRYGFPMQGWVDRSLDDVVCFRVQLPMHWQPELVRQEAQQEEGAISRLRFRPVPSRMGG
jgi:hypothetical protein